MLPHDGPPPSHQLFSYSCFSSSHSDIDLVVVSRSMETQRREGVLRSMAACLRRNNLATDVQVIARAKVPIIKFVCTHGRYRCDISVNQTNGLKAADYVNEIQSTMPAVRPLILLTKHLLQQRGMSEVYTGGLGSYSVILLVINFMQVSWRNICRSLRGVKLIKSTLLFPPCLPASSKGSTWRDRRDTQSRRPVSRLSGIVWQELLLRRLWRDGPRHWRVL